MVQVHMTGMTQGYCPLVARLQSHALPPDSLKMMSRGVRATASKAGGFPDFLEVRVTPHRNGATATKKPLTFSLGITNDTTMDPSGFTERL